MNCCFLIILLLFQAMFCCAAHVTEESQEFLDVLSAARSRHEGQEKRKEMRNAVRRYGLICPMIFPS